MAKAEVKNDPVYFLELTHREAETLYRLIGNHVCGELNGNRMYISSIYIALEQLGLNESELDVECRGSKTLFFKS